MSQELTTDTKPINKFKLLILLMKPLLSGLRSLKSHKPFASKDSEFFQGKVQKTNYEFNVFFNEHTIINSDYSRIAKKNQVMICYSEVIIKFLFHKFHAKQTIRSLFE